MSVCGTSAIPSDSLGANIFSKDPVTGETIDYTTSMPSNIRTENAIKTACCLKDVSESGSLNDIKDSFILANDWQDNYGGVHLYLGKQESGKTGKFVELENSTQTQTRHCPSNYYNCPISGDGSTGKMFSQGCKDYLGENGYCALAIDSVANTLKVPFGYDQKRDTLCRHYCNNNPGTECEELLYESCNFHVENNDFERKCGSSLEKVNDEACTDLIKDLETKYSDICSCHWPQRFYDARFKIKNREYTELFDEIGVDNALISIFETHTTSGDIETDAVCNTRLDGIGTFSCNLSREINRSSSFNGGAAWSADSGNENWDPLNHGWGKGYLKTGTQGEAGFGCPSLTINQCLSAIDPSLEVGGDAVSSSFVTSTLLQCGEMWRDVDDSTNEAFERLARAAQTEHERQVRDSSPSHIRFLLDIGILEINPMAAAGNISLTLFGMVVIIAIIIVLFMVIIIFIG